MKTFVERLYGPVGTEKYFMHYNAGGISICCDIKNGHTTPNCVGWSHGRVLQLMEAKKCDWNLMACDASGWYADAQKKGFTVGQTPKFGAIACWGKGSNGNGHVASVERIYSNGDIMVSESVYGGADFQTSLLRKLDGYKYGDKPFQGFIYLKEEFEGTIIDLDVTTEDYSLSKDPERFKVMKDGVQRNSYTSYNNAVAYCDRIGGTIVDSKTGKTIYPTTSKTVQKTYTVQSGDSLWGIATKMLGKGSRYKEIMKLNGLTSTTIYRGNVLKIPEE